MESHFLKEINNVLSSRWQFQDGRGATITDRYVHQSVECQYKSQFLVAEGNCIIDGKEKILKVVAEMPGIEKKDIKIDVVGSIINIDAEHGERKYHAKIPIRQKIDENSVKATYANGILEMKFKLKEEDVPKGKIVTV